MGASAILIKHIALVIWAAHITSAIGVFVFLLILISIGVVSV